MGHDKWKLFIHSYITRNIRDGHLSEALTNALKIKDMPGVAAQISLIYEGMGNLGEARVIQEEHHNSLLEHFSNQPSEESAFELILSFIARSRIQKRSGEVEEALSFLNQAYIIITSIIATSFLAEDTELLIIKSIICQDICESLLQQQAIEEAYQYCKEFNELIIRINTARPNETIIKSKLSTSYLFLGDYFYWKEEYNISLQYYLQANEIAKEIVTLNEDDSEYMTTLGLSFEKLGNVYDRLNDIPLSISCYEDYCRLMDALFRKHSDSSIFNFNLITSLQGVGLQYFRNMNYVKAMEYYDKCLPLIIQYEDQFTEVPEIKRAKAILYQHYGNLHNDRGDMKNAELNYIKMYMMFHELNIEFPNNRLYRDNYAFASCIWGLFQKEYSGKKAAFPYLINAQSIWTQLVNEFPLSVDYKHKLERILEINDELG